MDASRNPALIATALIMTLLLGACGGDEEIVFEGDYPIAFVQRDAAAAGNPIDLASFTPGGDLYIKDRAAPSAPQRNITAGYTRGRGDVADPEPSFDGRRLVFSMRGPGDPTWNIWEYDLDRGSLRRVIQDDALANAGDDREPHYLPDGRIVFTSTRQQRARALLAEEGRAEFQHLDEFLREPASVLHVMGADGSDIEQISFNQSHDRNPTVLSDGRIMYARWDNLGSDSRYPIYVINPDGSGQTLYYGADSPGNSFLQPRELADGRVLSSLLPLAGTAQGGALALIDIRNFGDAEHPTPGSTASGPGQRAPTYHEIPLGNTPSAYGRFTAPFPVWDGSARVLASFTPYRPAVQPAPGSPDFRASEGAPAYGVYVLDLERGTQRPVALAPQGRILTDAVALMPRERPALIDLPERDPTLAAEESDLGSTGVGIIDISSVYDPGFLNLDRALVEGEQLPQTPEGTVDLRQLSDPALATAADRPARFIRVSRALPNPPGLARARLGETDFPMQQVLGYANVEPDGSARFKVPADTPLMLAVVDRHGRALQTLTRWVQVRPGETLGCDGCRSPRRHERLNVRDQSGPWPNTRSSMSAEPGETMAQTRTRIGASPNQRDPLELHPEMAYRDVWTDPSVREPDAESNITYTTGPGGVLKETAVPRDGIINYPEHIQYGLWERPRPMRNGQAQTCIECHSTERRAGGLDLSNRLAPSGRIASYETLLRGRPVIDPDTGLAELETRNGELLIRREPPLIETGREDGGARASHLVERLFGARLRSSHDYDPSSDSFDHSNILNAAERRLLAEWIDGGAQYYNDPHAPAEHEGEGILGAGELRPPEARLDEAGFRARVHPILMSSCASCHSAVSVDGAERAQILGPRSNRFVLTGYARGDFHAAEALVSNLCQPAQSDLLRRPAATPAAPEPHPGRDGGREPILPADSADYVTILNWIADAVTETSCP